MKVIIIGENKDPHIIKQIEELRKKGNEVLLYSSVEEIPITERFDDKIQKIETFKIMNINRDIEMPFIDKKRKGHERPYKYHK